MSIGHNNLSRQSLGVRQLLCWECLLQLLQKQFRKTEASGGKLCVRQLPVRDWCDTTREESGCCQAFLLRLLSTPRHERSSCGNNLIAQQPTQEPHVRLTCCRDQGLYPAACILRGGVNPETQSFLAAQTCLLLLRFCVDVLAQSWSKLVPTAKGDGSSHSHALFTPFQRASINFPF